MTKEEFIQRWCKDPVIGMGSGVYLEFPEKLEAELDEIIQQAIAEHEAKAWKKYPDEKPPSPHKNLLYVQFKNGCISLWDYSLIHEWDDYVIAWRELPAPYKEGGEE